MAVPEAVRGPARQAEVDIVGLQAAVDSNKQEFEPAGWAGRAAVLDSRGDAWLALQGAGHHFMPNGATWQLELGGKSHNENWHPRLVFPGFNRPKAPYAADASGSAAKCMALAQLHAATGPPPAANRRRPPAQHDAS